MTRSISYNKIQPLRGWHTRFVNNPAFYTVLLTFNPFGILHSELRMKMTTTESPKDFNIANPKFNSGYMQKSAPLPRKPAYRIWRSELSVKTISTKSPKDFNIINPECNSGYKKRMAGNPEGVE